MVFYLLFLLLIPFASFASIAVHVLDGVILLHGDARLLDRVGDCVQPGPDVDQRDWKLVLPGAATAVVIAISARRVVARQTSARFARPVRSRNSVVT